MQCFFSVFKQTFFQSSGYCHIFIQQFLKFFWIFLYIFSAFFISYDIKWQEKEQFLHLRYSVLYFLL